MKKTLLAIMLGVALSGTVDAKPGGGGGGGGHASSGGSHSFSAPSSAGKGSFSAPAPRPAPVAPPTATKGSFSAPPAQTTTRTTTTVSRTYSSRYVSSGGYYGGWGMGYHYNNGLMTGLIIGSMMHPYGTVMYAGPGMYANNAVLYPNGAVVNQQGYQVGTYVNGQFVPMQNGPMVAQPAPADAGAQPVQQPQVVYVEKPGPSAGEIFGYVLGGLVIFVLLIILFGII
jgi:hypothetical protein